MANLPFEYHPDEVSEAHEAYEWCAEQSPKAAERFWSELVRARKQVVERPEGWTPYLHDARVFQFRKFPDGLVYRANADKIIGLAVCRLARKPGYWRDRV
jgi:plasmid stabilization system protein ParE